MCKNIQKLLDTLPDRIEQNMHRCGGIGLALGILICREILEREGEKDAVQLLHQQSAAKLLKRVASGDLIMQDQLVTGVPFDPKTEKKFQEIARAFLEQIK